MNIETIAEEGRKKSTITVDELSERILKGSEANGEKIVKNGQKDEGVRHPVDAQPLEIYGGAEES